MRRYKLNTTKYNPKILEEQKLCVDNQNTLSLIKREKLYDFEVKEKYTDTITQ